MIVLVMPRLSDSMEEGTIVRWLKADGDAVARGEALLEIETDKATETHESEHAGVLRIVAREGQTLPVGATIAEFDDGEPEPAPQAAPAAGAAEPGTAKGEVTVTEPSRAQQLIARRMAESRATVPAFTLRATVDMRACAELLESLSSSASPPYYEDLVVKACACALAEHPRVNGAYRDGRFERYARVNVGLTVAAQDALVVPTIFDADRKGLAQIAQEARALTGRARDGTITSPELAGATFTVHSLGAYGVRSFEPIINPAQAAALSIGAVESRPVARDGAVAVREQMDVELACDHRVLYGAQAAGFLARVKELLQEPQRIAL